MARKTYLLHSGIQPLTTLANELTECTYMWSDPTNMANHKLSPVFKNRIFNHDYLFAYFYLDKTSPWLMNAELLMQLPAHRILYSQDISVPEDIKQILDLRGAYSIDQADLATDVNRYFFDKDIGYRLYPAEITISLPMQNSVSYCGNTYLSVTSNSSDWQYLGRTARSTYVTERYATDYIIEFQTELSAELKIEIKCFAMDNHLIGTFTKSGAQLKADHGRITVSDIGSSYYYTIYYYIRGYGTVKVGTLHQRRSRGKYGLMELGGKSLIDRGFLNGEIAYLFNPGNMKPPLTVYFAGYHTAEAFEARGMLHAKGVPYLLISDMRVEGGTFYLGDQEIENKILTIIKDSLAKLHFTTKELVLSGMSMGTYASLYYGAVLNPGAIVIAKILLGLGTIAENLRINRPNDFHCSTDMVLAMQGSDDHEACQRMNDVMWQRLKDGDFSNTNFYLGYMRNDDYDGQAYLNLQNFLQTNYPDQHIVSKGYYGRHNDDNLSSSTWFKQQLFHVIRTKYGQKV